MKEERRRMMKVEDRPTEVGVKLNNILTALVLMVMSWVGWNIQEMRKDIVVGKLETAVMKQQIANIKERLYAHIADDEVHYYGKRKDK